MPERVTKEERLVSMVIAKAREVKELLHLSLNDNNRSPVDDKSEVVKLKRPKAEKIQPSLKQTKGQQTSMALQVKKLHLRREYQL